MKALMRAVASYRYGGPKVLRQVDLSLPQPRGKEVRIQVQTCGINLSDWEGLTGKPLYARLRGVFRPRKPVLGSDVVGTITALGDDVTDWVIGDQVWAEIVQQTGGFAQECLVPAARLARLPAGLDPVIAAGLPQPGSIALNGTMDVMADERVLINGAGGGSGPLAVQLAKAMDAHVTAVDHRDKAAFMRDQGADAIIDYRQIDFATAGQRYDLILDLVGTRRAKDIRPVLNDTGRYVLMGGTMRAIVSTLVATHRDSRFHMGIADGEPAILDRLGDMALAGTVTPVIAGTVNLDGLPDALAKVGAGQVAGKLVVLPNG